MQTDATYGFWTKQHIFSCDKKKKKKKKAAQSSTNSCETVSLEGRL